MSTRPDTNAGTSRTAQTSSQGLLSRRKVLAEQYDLGLAWMVAAVLGAVAISLIPERVGLWRMLVPILVAMGGFLMFALTRSHHSTPRVGDSVYFMGFLWTLWALINVLVRHPYLKAADLYVAFGYALVGTAAGMFIRLALLQFYRTLEDQEGQAVDRIDHRVAALVRELELSQQAAASLRAVGAMTLEEWHKQFVAASEQVLADVKNLTANLILEGHALTSSVQAVHQSLTPTGRLFTTLNERLSASTDRIAAGIDNSAESLESSVKVLVKRIEGVDIPPDLIQAKLVDVLNAVDASVKPVADFAVTTLRQLTEAIGEVNKAVSNLASNEQLREGVAKLVGSVNVVTQACQNLAQEAETFRQTLFSIDAALKTLSSQLEGVELRVTHVQTGVESVRVALDTTGRNVQKVDDTLRDVVRFVQSTIGDRR